MHLLHHSFCILIFVTFYLLCVCACLWLWACHDNTCGENSFGKSFLSFCVCATDWTQFFKVWQQAPTHGDLSPRLNTHLFIPLLYFLTFPSLPWSVELRFVSRTERRYSSTTASFASLGTCLHCREWCYSLWVAYRQPDSCNFCKNFHQPSQNHRLLLSVELLLADHRLHVRQDLQWRTKVKRKSSYWKHEVQISMPVVVKTFSLNFNNHPVRANASIIISVLQPRALSKLRQRDLPTINLKRAVCFSCALVHSSHLYELSVDGETEKQWLFSKSILLREKNS